MRRTRVIQNPTPQQVGPQKKPVTSADWARLMTNLLERCHRLGVNTTAMQAAYKAGKSEAYLRREGILTLNCIDREYPDRK